LLYFTENAQKDGELCVGCSSWVEILCPVLFGDRNLKKPLKTLEKNFKNL